MNPFSTMTPPPGYTAPAPGEFIPLLEMGGVADEDDHNSHADRFWTFDTSVDRPVDGHRFYVCIRCCDFGSPVKAAKEVDHREPCHPDDMNLGLCADHIHLLTAADRDWIAAYRRELPWRKMTNLADQIFASIPENARRRRIAARLDIRNWRDVYKAAVDGVKLDYDRYRWQEVDFMPWLCVALLERYGAVAELEALIAEVAEVRGIMRFDDGTVLPWELIRAACSGSDYLPCEIPRELKLDFIGFKTLSWPMLRP